ncbi:hypothetical protein GUITHDRAFT_105415 [Guillardia theta CCMP2712]|uniref:F-box domain-containing protein n=1 Tax=Guillardia theta (strain CCMP2712) TaxID=905079 RepID=L1JJV5_GUITC|nr:hypothetical protein GUITHDRAFT_105415 [Guillardia theta CCMP2712]EKX48788.1 hypothetical protein GUITHDRAFT_105415 [Guillardia theta CCMP2712]|eukprot:XP_005835768.1 hypothetical protein GUITHDRAFT_105415 [Guillardia theta CCMP2712]
MAATLLSRMRRMGLVEEEGEGEGEDGNKNEDDDPLSSPQAGDDETVWDAVWRVPGLRKRIGGKKLKQVVEEVWRRLKDNESQSEETLDANDTELMTRGVATYQGITEVMVKRIELLVRVMRFLPSVHMLFPLSCVCRSWYVAFLRARSLVGAMDLTSAPKIEDLEFLWHIKKYGKAVRRVDISGCKYLSDIPLLDLCEKSRGLEELRVRDCRRLTDVGVSSILRKHRGTLRVLDVTRCYLDEGAFWHLFSEEGGGKVEVLQCAYCPLGDLFAGFLAQMQRRIKCLNLCGCR